MIRFFFALPLDRCLSIDYFCIIKSQMVIWIRYNAKVAQLVERDLAKVEVAGSNPVFRSTKKAPSNGAFFVIAGMVELVDTPDLKSCGPQARAGSTPAPGTRPYIKGYQESTTKATDHQWLLLFYTMAILIGTA